MRFYGRTGTNVTRVLHFKTWAKSVVSYFTTGLGSINMPSFRFMHAKLNNHTARACPPPHAAAATRRRSRHATRRARLFPFLSSPGKSLTLPAPCCRHRTPPS